MLECIIYPRKFNFDLMPHGQIGICKKKKDLTVICYFVLMFYLILFLKTIQFLVVMWKKMETCKKYVDSNAKHCNYFENKVKGYF